MTASIAEPRLYPSLPGPSAPKPSAPKPSAPKPSLSGQTTGPVLRRLADILPSSAPAAPESPPSAAPTADRMADPVTHPWASAQVEQVLRAMVEILDGRRPARQLSMVLRPDLLSYLTRLQPVAGGLQPRVHKVLSRQQGTGVLEAVALVGLRTGVRALAARFEEQPIGGDKRWYCTALQLRLTTGDLAACRRR